jgi:hexosaminidase
MQSTRLLSFVRASLLTLVVPMSAMVAGPRALPAQSEQGAPEAAVIPYPASVAAGAGTYSFGERPLIAIAPRSAELRALATLASDILRQETGARAAIGTSGSATAALSLAMVPRDSARGAESYRLEVTPRGVTITAPAGAGLFYGLQSLRQLLAAQRMPSPSEPLAAMPAGGPRREPPYRRIALAGVRIDDAPRFPYRGMHLDVGRHMFPVAFLERYIDLMARYKYNRFHWHLTEDQGWRIEIRKYPRLAEVGGCRPETLVNRNFQPYMGDATPYCGYYTQEQVKHIVAYAAARYVTVIPEIEMPGHSKAALAAYPELACTAGPFDAWTSFGVQEEIFCPSERTFSFLEDVLSEVVQLFPSRYIHIGGDEAPKARWRASPLAAEVMAREKLKDVHELQSYFIRRIEKFLASRGRRIIGWDEILEGGLAPGATVMSWRGTAGGIAAARAGHDVIMTPGSHVYLDHQQGDPRYEPLSIGDYLPLEKVYSFDPVPDSLTAEQARFILGGQANIWTEYMKTSEYVEYMAYPRALALSEVFWTPKDRRQYASFGARLLPQIAALDEMGVRNRFPSVEGLDRDRTVAGDSVTVTLRSPLPGTQIRYTLDGRQPTASSPLYERPLVLPLTPTSTQVTARVFWGTRRMSPSRAATFTAAAPPSPATSPTSPATTPVAPPRP